MRKWLVVAAVVLGAGSSAAQAEMKGLGAGEAVSIARARTIDLRLAQGSGYGGHAPLVPSMLVRRDVMPNGALGLGLASFYARRKGAELRPDEKPRLSRKPAVTFVLRF